MTVDTSVPRTRRALLAGGIGGLAAVAASALGRVPTVLAADPNDVLLGGTNNSGSTTLIQNTTTTAVALRGRATLSDGVGGETGADAKSGVFGLTTNGNGYGVYGHNNPRGTKGYLGGGPCGAYGYRADGPGVWGESQSERGAMGTSESGTGVYGQSRTGSAVMGFTLEGTKAALVGGTYGTGTGVQGFSGGSSMPTAPAKTGVYGFANQDAVATGVYGQSTAGRGVLGIATSGVGVRALSTSGTGTHSTTATGTALYAAATTSGLALRTSGRVSLEKASGVATIVVGNTSVLVTPGLDVTASSFVLLTPKADIGTRRIWYTPDATANTITIRVSSAVTGTNLAVGWLLLG